MITSKADLDPGKRNAAEETPTPPAPISSAFSDAVACVSEARKPQRSRARPLPVTVTPADDSDVESYLLRLYVAGVNGRSSAAIANLKAICEEHLKGRYQLEVVDIYQQPSLARSAQIVAAPTLIRRLPPPLRRIVGDLSQKDRVLVGLDLLPRS